MGRLIRLTAMSLMLVLVAAACSSGEESKAGGQGPPIVLTIGTNDFPGRPAADQIEKFAARVAELSEGEITIEPVWRVGGMNTPNWDQAVVRQVVNGELDMGNIPSRAFDILGVTSLQALNAPFLITSDELLKEVVASDLSDDMLSGLEEIGLVGLAVQPEGLRHPFGFDEALLGPDDYEGETIRAPASATTAAVFEALGATVVGGEIDPDAQAGMESAYSQDPLGISTGNVVFFPKANVLVVNDDVFTRLNESQTEILEQAASETVSWSTESLISDATAGEEWCASGGRVVTADREVLTALEDAVEPVYQDLRSDQLTAELIDQIEEIKRSVTVSEPVIPDGCANQPVDREVATAEGTDDPSVVNGSYRVEWGADELFQAYLQAGASEAPPDVIEEIKSGSADNAGVTSLTLNDGHFEYIYETGFFAGDHCNGTYAISGGRITMVASSDPAEWQCGHEDLGRKFVDAAWEVTNQSLLLTDFRVSDEPDVTWVFAVSFSKPFVRVD